MPWGAEEEEFGWEAFEGDSFACAAGSSKEAGGDEEEGESGLAAFAVGSGGGGGGVEGCVTGCVWFWAGCSGCCGVWAGGAETFCSVLAFGETAGLRGSTGFVAFMYMYAPTSTRTMKSAAARSFMGGCLAPPVPKENWGFF